MRVPPHKIAAVILFVAGASVFFSWIPDDAYVSFRYARNLAEGHGLVFNPGERVEGYSNFMWTLLLGLARKAGLDIVTTARVLSIVCALAAILMALRLFRRITEQTAVGPDADAPSHLLQASLMLVVSLPMAYWATSGLETFAAALFLLMGAVLHLKAEREQRPRIHVASIAAFLCLALLRPEGVVYLLLNAVVLRARLRGRMPRSVVVSLVASVAVFAVFLASRSLYYHSLVPNTYWAKPSTALGYFIPLRRGVKYITRYSVITGLVLFLPVALYGVFKLRSYAVYYLGGLLLVQFAFIVWVGGDVLRFDRFTVAFNPVLLALILAGLVALRTGRTSRRWLRRAVWGAVAISLTLSCARIYRAHSKYCIHDWMHAHVHRALGEALRDMLPPDATLSFNEIGAVPYYSRLVTYDMIGLTDKTIGAIVFDSYRRYGTTATDECQSAIGDYIMARNPTCVILPSYGPIDFVHFSSPRDLFHPIWYGIYANPTFQSSYHIDFSIQDSQIKYLNVFLRNGVEVDHAPLARLRGLRCVRVWTY